MDISLLISTKDRAKQLYNCLNHIKKIQCIEDWELVLVNNGSSDDTEEIAKDFAKKADFDVHILNGPGAGKGIALNIAIEKARGKILAFIDDDCYPRYDFLEQISKVFGDSDLGYMSGRVLLYDKYDFPITINTRDYFIDFPAKSYLPPGVFLGANMAGRRDVIVEIGGFDPLFGAGTPFACDDIDLCTRISFAGWKGRYDPGPTVYHHHRRRDEKTLKNLMKLYDIARGAYHVKFILNHQTRMVYIRHWYWQIKGKTKAQFINELYGSAYYCVKFFFLALFEYIRRYGLKLTDKEKS